MHSESRPYRSCSPAAIAWRFVLFGALWLFLSGANISGWPFGLAATLAAVWLHLRLAAGDPRRLRPMAVLRFIPYFVGRSILSGVDVMKRVLHPAMPIDPALIDFPLHIDHEGGRVLLADCVSLLPGTISARLGREILLIHTLDKGLPVLSTVRDLERRIEKLYLRAARPEPAEERR
ncbi:MAG: Na+/H+ antiporter subunit E [Desulfurivibrionaceae bacterium]